MHKKYKLLVVKITSKFFNTATKGNQSLILIFQQKLEIKKISLFPCLMGITLGVQISTDTNLKNEDLENLLLVKNLIQ